jgi:hypothetical protein
MEILMFDSLNLILDNQQKYKSVLAWGHSVQNYSSVRSLNTKCSK